MGFHHVGQAGLKLLTSPGAGITGVSHHAFFVVRLSLCHCYPGWSAVAGSQLTATSAPGFA